MYRLTVHDFLALISKGLKKQITEDEVFAKEIKIAHLKRIDNLFEKGLHYYLDPKAPVSSKEASVFFRKTKFATDDLSIGAIKTVNRFEDLKLSINAIAKLSGVEFKRHFPKYSINIHPQEAAQSARGKLYPKFNTNRRDFLKALITKFAENNILVFEFIETWNKVETANIDGFFLKPNMIVLKRHQGFTREIFTLAHELGHYLLEVEEIERFDYQTIANRNLSKTERWCNDFAYYFLVGEYAETIKSLERASLKNDYHFDMIKRISDHTHLSQIALYTRLLYDDQISKNDYTKIRAEFDEAFRKKQEEREREKQILKEQGVKQRGSVAKPIRSPLFVSTIQAAFYEGVLNEYEVCKKLNIKPDKIDLYIQ